MEACAKKYTRFSLVLIKSRSGALKVTVWPSNLGEFRWERFKVAGHVSDGHPPSGADGFIGAAVYGIKIASRSCGA